MYGGAVVYHVFFFSFFFFYDKKIMMCLKNAILCLLEKQTWNGINLPQIHPVDLAGDIKYLRGILTPQRLEWCCDSNIVYFILKVSGKGGFTRIS